MRDSTADALEACLSVWKQSVGYGSFIHNFAPAPIVVYTNRPLTH